MDHSLAKRILHIEGRYDREIVEAKFREFAKKNHPDKGGSSSIYQEGVEAREFLNSNEEIVSYSVDVDEVACALGLSISINLSHSAKCPTCRGSIFDPSCKVCSGSGKPRGLAAALSDVCSCRRPTCPTCEGLGTINIKGAKTIQLTTEAFNRGFITVPSIPMGEGVLVVKINPVYGPSDFQHGFLRMYVSIDDIVRVKTLPIKKSVKTSVGSKEGYLKLDQGFLIWSSGSVEFKVLPRF